MIPSPEAVSAAQNSMRVWRVPASPQLGQYALESGWGQHMPPGSNNPFGIKALLHQPSVTVMTHEFQGGRFVAVPQPFRIFPTLAAAFDAHAELIATMPIYVSAMAALPDMPTFVMRMAAHYATDPFYGAKLLALIREDGLEKYDI